MKIENKRLSEITPYENNPRHNEASVDKVAASIREFGFKVPIVIDKDGVIITGHTRYKAAQKLGLETVPTITADDLSEEKVRAYRLADNKAGEDSEWNSRLLALELKEISEINMDAFGFTAEEAKNWFNDREQYDNNDTENQDEGYQEFVKKFEEKKTTDDCYTPNRVYDAVADYVSDYYGEDKKGFIRPFYPGGDYKKEKYPEGCVVVDNPPFSILAEIQKYYNDNGIKFFLFAPGLTSLQSDKRNCTIACGVAITYENGARVSTSFLTNMESGVIAKTDPELYQTVKKANDEEQKEKHKTIKVYSFPNEVVTAAMLNKYSKYGQNFEIKAEEASEKINILDAMRCTNPSGIFGGAFLLSEKAAAEKAAAEKAAAEKAAADVWELSDREKDIVRSLGK